MSCKSGPEENDCKEVLWRHTHKHTRTRAKMATQKYPVRRNVDFPSFLNLIQSIPLISENSRRHQTTIMPFVNIYDVIVTSKWRHHRRRHRHKYPGKKIPSIHPSFSKHLLSRDLLPLQGVPGSKFCVPRRPSVFNLIRDSSNEFIKLKTKWKEINSENQIKKWNQKSKMRSKWMVLQSSEGQKKLKEEYPALLEI